MADHLNIKSNHNQPIVNSIPDQSHAKSSDAKPVTMINNEPMNLKNDIKFKKYSYITEPNIFSSTCWKNPCQKEKADDDFTFGEFA